MAPLDSLARLRIPPPPRISRTAAYGYAVLVPLVTLAIQHTLLPLVQLVPFILFFLAVFLVSWLGGRGPGFVAIGISALAADYHFLPPFDRLSTSPRALVLVGLFCFVSSVVNLLSASVAEAYQEARRAIRIRDDFLSVAGHELRTPLTTLKLQVDALLQQSRADCDPIQDKRAERVERSLARLAKLVDELLDVSRISAGRPEIMREDCDLCDLTRRIVEQMRDAASRAGSEIVLDAPDRVTGRWDPMRLEQVVSNLLDNAIKFGAARPIAVRVTLDDRVARVAISDSGIGIPPQDRSRVFDRFEQANSPRQYGGLGLGLWIAQQVVQGHGGAIRVAANPEGGTTFTVSLPVERASAAGGGTLCP